MGGQVEERIRALEEELQQQAKKFDEWKAKAKASVEKHREQIVSLSAELEEARRDSTRSKALVSGCAAWAHGVSSTAFDAAASHADACWIARGQAADTDAALLRGQLAESAAQFDKYKKRAEQTLRLSSKDHQGMLEESSKVKEALEQALVQLGEAREAVNQRNIAIAVLEKQLDDMNVVVDSLHAQLEQFQGRGSGVDGAKGAHSISESEVEKVRQEFGEREAIIFEQHRDEILRLTTAHELEMTAVRQEEEEKLAAALSARSRDTRSSAASRDNAYDALLTEHDKIKLSAASLAEENRLLREQVAKLQPRGDSGAAPLSNATPAQLQSRVHELERHVAHLSDQLWTANHNALEAKSAASAKDAPQSGPQARVKPDAQQQSYFRSVLVKMLCARTDDVRSSLMPVLTTIAQLEANDLRVIYSANPGWIK